MLMELAAISLGCSVSIIFLLHPVRLVGEDIGDKQTRPAWIRFDLAHSKTCFSFLCIGSFAHWCCLTRKERWKKTTHFDIIPNKNQTHQMVAAGSLFKMGNPQKKCLYQKVTVPLLNEPLAWTYATVPWLDHQSTGADGSTPCCLYHSLLSDYIMLTVVIIAIKVKYMSLLS